MPDGGPVHYNGDDEMPDQEQADVRLTLARLRQEHARTIYLAGLLPALMALVPFANLLVPMFATSYFTHIFKSLARGSSAGRGTDRE